MTVMMRVRVMHLGNTSNRTGYDGEDNNSDGDDESDSTEALT